MPDPAQEGQEATPKRRQPNLVRDFFRPSKGQFVAALVLFSTALLVTWTLQSQRAQPEFANARQADLVQLLDSVTSQSRALEEELRELQSTRDELLSGADQAETARKDAERRREQLQILAGTVPASGPGIRIKIDDPDSKVTAELILNAIEELRDAGAEVIEINDQVRVVTNTAFTTDGDGNVLAGGEKLDRPYIIDAIGDPVTLESGARFRGGLVSEVEGSRVGGTVAIEQLEQVMVESVVTVDEYEFARPR